ncbi:MIF-like protein mif-2 [Caenorhabditis elegans]|uniref:MIF-like protein mif-2 n=3 Tax=Caenorhabditis elegans TaxID=6239 RepID=MIF2_CAEEL|nr:MIF-like protein mif-2 [Caenorhabditis elegans]Q18785.1 RecName: Full=MIF-like protein mif-2 [Caenorhabditis elegans]CAB01412.1 MIF-like protein mif-2 [Caenorhabditis elegans]|eukprot:NP_001256386.1 MIF-like protein mif-2 [Caenorhabditis elegans]
MPMVRVATNLPNEKVPVDFEIRLTDLLARSMGKPRERIAVEIAAGARLVHGATHDPVTVISIKSIGAVSAEDNIRNTAAITEFCGKELGLPKDKVVITFHDLPPATVGFNGTTVAEANKK